MKPIAIDLTMRLGLEATTLATCWKLVRTDGYVLGFTDHSSDLSIDGVTYRANTGFTPSAINSNSAMSVDNQELQSILSDNSIKEVDLVGGRYDMARIEVFWVDWELVPTSLSSSPPGHLLLLKGILGEVKNTDFSFSVEVRSLAQLLSQRLTTLTSRQCRATLGDSSCKVNLTPHTHTVSITGVTNNRRFSTTNPQADGYFAGGQITFASGENNGLKAMIASYTGGVFTLFEAMPFAVQAGNQIVAVRGCDKQITTCTYTYGNILNFQGEPHIPGEDKYLAGFDG